MIEPPDDDDPELSDDDKGFFVALDDQLDAEDASVGTHARIREALYLQLGATIELLTCADAIARGESPADLIRRRAWHCFKRFSETHTELASMGASFRENLTAPLGAYDLTLFEDTVRQAVGERP